jgi:hypothetical protein
MAVLINYTTDSGIELTNAYAKIEHYHGRNSGDESHANYEVYLFASAGARSSNKAPVASFGFTCPTPVGDILPALYADLKTQEPFTAAVDA